MRFSQNLILLPVAVQVTLTLAVLILMGFVRARSAKAMRKSMQDLALATDADWTAEATQVSNNFKNQFELPVLFYVGCAFALITRSVDSWMFALAALFVLSRIVHTAVHVTSNIVMLRGSAYLFGAVSLLLLWITLVWRVAVAGW
jgi:hypothetical protein